MLMLWVRLPDEEIELAFGYDDEEGEEGEGEEFDPHV